MAEVEIATKVEMPVGRKVRILKRLDFSQPPEWKQDVAWIVVKLRHLDGENALSVISVDGDEARLLPASEARALMSELAEAATTGTCLGEDEHDASAS